MTREELSETLDLLRTVTNNAWKACETTSIPAHYIINYIKEETGIDIVNVVYKSTTSGD